MHAAVGRIKLGARFGINTLMTIRTFKIHLLINNKIIIFRLDRYWRH